MTTTTLVLLIVACVVLGLAFALVIAAFVLWFLRQSGGFGDWGRIVTEYPAQRPADGTQLVRQTVQCGSVVYKRCATVVVDPSGLYLEIGRRCAAIPWHAISRFSNASLYWQKLYVLHIGDPPTATVGVQRDLFRKIQPHLAHLASADHAL